MASTLPPLLQASSGAIGSAVANALVFPLDLVTTRLQTASPQKGKGKSLTLLETLHHLLHKKGLSSLYAGLEADTLSTFLSNFLYFGLYSLLRRVTLKRHGGKALSGPEEILVGLLAGIMSKAVTLPIGTVCVRQQMDEDGQLGESGKQRRSFLAILQEVMQERGVLGFWAGLVPSIPLALTPSLTMYFNTLLLRMLLPVRKRAHPPAMATFASGAGAGVLAILPLYPLLLIKTLSQSNQRQASTLVTGQEILRREGFTGLYRGLEGQLAKCIVQQGVTLLVKQRVEEAVVRAYTKRMK